MGQNTIPLEKIEADISAERDAYERDPLGELRKVFHKWFKYQDETLLDLCLAVKIHSLQLDKYAVPLWLIVVGVSGDRKSSTVLSFYDDGIETYFLNYLTPNTLVSGQKKNVKRDLTPKLDRKLVISGDTAQFLKMHPDKRSAIWSQLREAYDGRVQKDTGSGVNTFYKDIRWDWILCATYAIYGDLLLKDQLGTRELIYHMPESENENHEDKERMMKAVLRNIDLIEQRDRELKDAVAKYIDWWKSQEFNDYELPSEIEKALMQYACFVSQLRVSAECDWRTGDLTNFVYPEKPTRILQQLTMLFKCLKQLNRNYDDQTALARIFEIVKSSIHPVRIKILRSLDGVSLSTTKLAHKVGLAYPTTNRELQICKHLDLVTKTQDTISGGSAFIWELNESHPLIGMVKQFSESEGTVIQIDELMPRGRSANNMTEVRNPNGKTKFERS